MTTEGEPQPVRLASIVALDIVGFSTMSEKNQQLAADKVASVRKRVEEIVARNDGRIFNTAGDGFMLEFASAGKAVAAIDELINRKPKGEPAIRVGAHVGDVIVAANNDLLGHGVNVAARLQSLAAPNSALVSGEFRSMARTSPSAAFKSKGRQPLENINQRVATFTILSRKQRVFRTMGRLAWGAAFIGAAVGGALVAPTAMNYAKTQGWLAFLEPKAAPVELAEAPPIVEQPVAAAAAPLANTLPPVPAQPEAPIVTEPTPATPPPEERLQPGQIVRDCDACPELIVLPAGAYMMGSPDKEAGRSATEGPQREVTLKPIAMGTHEVTFAEWDACLADGGCNGFSPQDQAWGRGRRPAMGVSWDDAQSYVAWLNRKAGRTSYRLPTEAEWEYAARAGTMTRYAFGNSIKRAQAVFGAAKTDPVGSYIANAFGLFDMHGNVWEWVADCHKAGYADAPVDGAAVDDPACKLRVYRGGGYEDKAENLRSANRRRAAPTMRSPGIGFRVVRDAG